MKEEVQVSRLISNGIVVSEEFVVVSPLAALTTYAWLTLQDF